MRGRADTGGRVDVDPHVALVGQRGFARVDPHSHANGPVAEGRLGGLGRCDRVRRAAEREEERISLCVDLDAVVPAADVAKRPSMIREQLGIVVAVLLQQAGGAFDVREDERDGAGRKIAQDRTRMKVLPLRRKPAGRGGG